MPAIDVKTLAEFGNSSDVIYQLSSVTQIKGIQPPSHKEFLRGQTFSLIIFIEKIATAEI
ncbi:MAG: hypothetical protein AUI36_14630 [Cyanobacteria bacterium 13_1_40CM_2_61_4]|nr:MAG: hypothetical protein AUI36_14630 [Cyanobacteria bacterium 13_1_40CM_2_61_4]